MRIDRLDAKQVLDTRGRPTIEVTISANTCTAVASVPAGKSTGSHEAHELRDADGGVTQALAQMQDEIAHAIVGKKFDAPEDLDTFLIELDGTPEKSRLGANAILAISIAATRLSAMLQDVPLWHALAKRAGTTPEAPRLFVNVMNGGVHADFKLPFQEYMLVVDGKPSDAFHTAENAFAKLGEKLGVNTPMGDEGGYAPMFDTLPKPFELLEEIVKESPGTSIAIDAAASELLRDGTYAILRASYSADDLAQVYADLALLFPIHSIEDPFEENAFGDFSRLTDAIGHTVLIVGDDLTVTNPARIAEAAKRNAVNAVIIKPNQIGTVSEAIRAVQRAYAAGFRAVASHRSGETADTFIADFAYAIGAHGIKAGGLGQKERLEKYHRLLAIEREAEALV